MEFSDTELERIEHACRSVARTNLERAATMDRPIQRNQANDLADEFLRIAEKIDSDRRQRALATRGGENCDD